jgi:hypothetical protein
MNEPDVEIKNHTDWQEKFPGGQPEVIVDPMIFRSADVYLRGRKGVEQSLPGKKPDDVWKALSANVGSLVTFFDALILSERLPIIDYGFTYDSQIGFDQYDLYRVCNNAANAKLLVSVHVMMAAYKQAKAAAVEEMRERPAISDELAASIRQEMSAFDYNWQPDLSMLGELPEDEEQLVLLRFLYGGLLFSAYAQTTGAAHLLQPKRSRLYLAASLDAPSASYDYERELFDELTRIARQTEGLQEGLIKVDAFPSFLPFLLSRAPASPDQLLRSALSLRGSGAVSDYRSWRRQLIDDWRDEGKIDRANEKKIREITRAVRRELGLPEEMSLDVGLSVGLTGVGIKADRALPVGRLWGWVLRQLPGRRYTKLLTRMHLAAREYRHLDRHLLTLWKNARG